MSRLVTLSMYSRAELVAFETGANTSELESEAESEPESELESVFN